jgi:hypothetical protein
MFPALAAADAERVAQAVLDFFEGTRR